MNYAVVTGASSGIGADFARNLSARGYGLILVARREDRLKALAEELLTPVEIFTADLSRREECERLGEFLNNFEIKVFINCAGFGDAGSFTETDIEKELRMINVNVTALHILSKIALKQLQKYSETGPQKRRGYLLNVGSSAGLLPAGPYMATYYATKAYVVSLSQAITQELKESDSNISVSVLCPGPVNTEFNSVANVKFALPGISSRFCANYAIKKMFQGTSVIIPGTLMKLACLASKFMPRSWSIKVAGLQQKKKLGE